MDKRIGPLLLFAAVVAALVVSLPRPAVAFGDVGAFEPRVLLVGDIKGAARPSAPGRWSWELIQRTSAPARRTATSVRADANEIAESPFLYLSGEAELLPLTTGEIMGLRRFFALGGLLFVDDAGVDAAGEPSAFGRSARREIGRVLPDTVPIRIGADHVVFKSFYLLRRAEGRVEGPRHMDAIVRRGAAQVIFSSHDVGGALARGTTGMWEHPVTPGGDTQRERAVRLAVNIAMYALCSNYKDDQVHAPFLMRRRAILGPRSDP